MSKTNLYNLDLNLLIVLDAIYNEKSLTLAGERLNITQSAISHSLAKLRDYFQDKLFLRQGNKMEPTPLCSALQESISPALLKITLSIDDRGKFVPEKSTRSFRLGMSDYLCTVLLPEIIKIVSKEAPGVCIHTSPPTHEQRLLMLREGKLDIFLGTPRNYGPAIKSQYLFSDKETCIFRENHPLIKNTLCEDDLSKLDFLAFSLSESGQGFLEELLHKKGLVHRIKMIVQQELTIPHLVCNSDLVGAVAEKLALHFSKIMPIKYLSIPIGGPEFDIYQSWHSRNDFDPANIWMRSIILRAAELIH
jgi:DNA-binding transcriptional LysR family regulator